MSYILGFDYGSKRIGVAIGQFITYSARPLITLPHKEALVKINTLITEWKPVALVVGISYHADGSKTPFTLQIEDFIKTLTEKYNLPIHTIDERLSSQTAKDLLFEQNQAYNKNDLDKYAACVILESWFSNYT